MSETEITIEEALLKKIKDEGLQLIIDDDEILMALAKKAMKEALFQPRRVAKGGYSYGYDEEDSPVVESARKIADEVTTRMAQELMGELVRDDEFRESVVKYMVMALPVVLRNVWQDSFSQTAHLEQDNLVKIMQNRLALPG